MNPHVIIPVRLDDARLPGKPLRTHRGAPLLKRVWANAVRAGVGDVWVATDSERVVDAARSWGALAVLTDAAENGTDRVRLAVEALGIPRTDVVVNPQSDNPEVPPAALREVLGHAVACPPHNRHSTLFCMRERLNEADYEDEDVVKVVVRPDDRAVFFTRQPYPGAWRHCGIYAHWVPYLLWSEGAVFRNLEKVERLEQMRAIENCVTVVCPELKSAPTVGRAIHRQSDLRG